jgi:hypothetical protein
VCNTPTTRAARPIDRLDHAMVPSGTNQGGVGNRGMNEVLEVRAIRPLRKSGRRWDGPPPISRSRRVLMIKSVRFATFRPSDPGRIGPNSVDNQENIRYPTLDTSSGVPVEVPKDSKSTDGGSLEVSLRNARSGRRGAASRRNGRHADF